MAPTVLANRTVRFLEDNRVAFDVIPHRESYTAQGVAATSHVSGWRLAKVLVVDSAGKDPLIVVLPASCRLDLPALERLTGRSELRLAPELDVQKLFPDCETGAMPPFGNLYGLPVWVDACFPKSQEFVFQAGNHHEVVKVRYEDFERLVKPTVADFCRH